MKVPIFGIDRLRMGTDGKGVTTLVAFMDCPLKCKFCLNKRCHESVMNRDGSIKDWIQMLMPQELYDIVKIDSLYFQATGGGICFGGGEPLLYADFIREFRRLCGDKWKITVETSLYVSSRAIAELSDVVDCWIVDVKSMNYLIYQKYTGKQSRISQSLASLKQFVSPDKVTIKVPFIPGFNQKEDLKQDIELIKHQFGFVNVKIVDYIVDL